MVQQDAGDTELDQAELRGYFSWHHPFRTLRIYMHPTVIGTLQNRVLLGCFAARPFEVGGILLGNIFPSELAHCVVIDDLQFIDPTTELFNTSDVDSSRLEAAMKRPRTDSGLRPVGYFRSDIREGLSLGPQDRSFIEENLRDPDDVFLLIRPDEIGVCAAAFFLWEDGQLQTKVSELKLASISDESPSASDLPVSGSLAPEAAPQQLLASIEQRLAAALHRGVAGEEHAAQQPIGATRDAKPLSVSPEETHDPQSHTSRPAPNPTAPQPSSAASHQGGQPLNLLVWALACMLLVSLWLAGYFALQAGRSRKQAAGNDHAGIDIGLRVEAVRGWQLNVSWNQHMPQLTAMQDARLTIIDGSVRRDLHIDNSQFRFGKLMYIPNSTDVQFQLEVFLTGDRSMAESMRVVMSAPQGGMLRAELVPPRVIENSRQSSVEAPKKPASADSITKFPAAAPFTARLAEPLLKQRMDGTNHLNSIAAPEVPASTQPDLPPSVAQNFPVYGPPKKGMEPPPTFQSSQKAQITNSNHSTFIPPPNDEPAYRRITRPEGAQDSRTAEPAESRDQASSTTESTEPSAPTESARAQIPTAPNYTPPVAVREVRPTVPLGVLGVISSEQAVDVLVNIDPKGRVTQARLLASKGAVSGLLSQSALDAVHEYRFQPARRNGVPVASTLTITFRFVR